MPLKIKPIPPSAKFVTRRGPILYYRLNRFGGFEFYSESGGWMTSGFNKEGIKSVAYELRMI